MGYVAYRRKGKLPAIMTDNRKVAIDIRSHSYPMTQILGTGKGDGLAGLGIHNLSADGVLRQRTQR